MKGKRNREPVNSLDKAKNFKKTIKKLLNYLKDYKKGLIIVIVFSVLSSLFAIIGPKILGKATTEIFNGVVRKFALKGGIDFGLIGKILLVLLLLYVVSAIFSYVQQYIMTGISQKISYNLRDKISKKMHKIPFKYYEGKTTGELLSRLTNDVDIIGQNLSQSLTQIITSIVSLIGIIIMMLSISPLLTGLSVLVIPVHLFLLVSVIMKSQKYFNLQQEYLGHLNSQVEETYGGHIIVKTNNGEDKEIKKFNETNNTLYESAWKGQFYSGMMGPVMTFIGNIGYVLVSVVGGYLTIKNKIQVGDILAFSQYIRNFNQPMMQVANIASLMQSTAAAAERVFEFLEEEEEVNDVLNPASIKGIKGEIVFDNVSFGYSKNKTIINDLNVRIKPGSKVAIVGPTGAGKTTIVKLLMRFYDVDTGKIMIDNKDIRDFRKEDLRSLFGMVLQDTWLFNGTIRDNIRYGKLDANDKEIENASKEAYIDYFINTLPLGYEMMIDEDTSNISLGQKQLLTIARVVLANPKILILDEATSSVDTRTEVLIGNALDKLMKGRTSFVIAHRLSTVRNADMILVIDNGDIVEMGTHTKLLEKNGFYASIYNSQFEGR